MKEHDALIGCSNEINCLYIVKCILHNLTKTQSIVNGLTGALENAANLVAQDSVEEHDILKLNRIKEGGIVMVDQRFMKIAIYPNVQVL